MSELATETPADLEKEEKPEPKEDSDKKPTEPKEDSDKKSTEPKQDSDEKSTEPKQDSDEKSTEPKEENDEKPTEHEEKIISQIEYYFGDHNLGKDRFMQGKMKEDDGWIPFDVLMTFNRLKSLTEDIELVVNALKKSENNLIQINEDKSKIRRNPDKPVPQRENWKEEEWNRTLYVKGFPVDSTMDAIMEFFKNEGNVSNIFMRKKYHSKVFKGSVFVTFETKDEIEEFLKKEGQKYKNTVLIKERRHDYQTRKHEEFTKRREDREKRKLERQEKDVEEQEKAVADFNPEEDMKKDCLMKLTGFSKDTKREHIKDILSPHGAIAYVDFKIGEEEAVVRFEESGVQKDVFEKSKTGEGDDEKKLIINGAEISATFPEGEEEIEYWKKIVRAKSSFSKDRRNHKRRGGGQFGYRGGKNFRGGRSDFRGRGRGRGRSQDRNERNGDSSNRKRTAAAGDEGSTPVKKEKTES